ncbi:hypothetical protein GCM10010967_33560 [Dyadobacter beijingensis]|uniref:Uncharacterized protein n=1 Tax=Dyadobacter beijingensis TaxID=365489 RepID=A0ABQ2I430_9BACT|nr:hypothetical protein [Dyadobacter beijingensis]GGM97025.1 hypothetical protein GCM10010967_33560 [Dyadobacter beijingensis]
MRSYLIIAFLACTGLAAQAQTRYKTDEPIISQIKNGTAPGFLFSKEAPARKETVTRPANQGSLGQQIRGNTVPGMVYQKAETNVQPVSQPNTQTKPDTSAIDKTGLKKTL